VEARKQTKSIRMRFEKIKRKTNSFHLLLLLLFLRRFFDWHEQNISFIEDKLQQVRDIRYRTEGIQASSFIIRNPRQSNIPFPPHSRSLIDLIKLSHRHSRGEIHGPHHHGHCFKSLDGKSSRSDGYFVWWTWARPSWWGRRARGAP
jgi:hypothetical protein